MSLGSATLRLISSPRAKAVAICLLAAIAGLYLVLPISMGLAAGDIRHAVWSYNGASTALSYFDTGFARRELEGTLIRLFTANPMLGGLAFHLAACSILLAVAVVAISRAALPDRNRLAIGAVLLGVFANVAVDVGRADPAIMICGLVAAWGARTGRWIVASAGLSVALAFHETGFIVFAPLVACIAWESGTWRAGAPAARLGGVILVCGGLLGYLFALGAHVDVQTLGRRIHAEFVNPRLSDLSVYYTLSGTRGLASILCQQRLDSEYVSKIAKGCALIGLLSFALRPRRWAITIAATLTPFLFLSAIALDLGRWMAFAGFGIAVLTVMDGLGTIEAEVPRVPRANVFLAVAAASLMMLRPQLIDLGDPIPIIPNFEFGPGSRRFDPVDAATQCDPRWKQFIGLSS